MYGIEECLAEAMGVPGVRGASLVDWSSGLVLGAVGEGPPGSHEIAAAETTEVVAAAVQCRSATTGAAEAMPVEDIIITTSGYHLIRFVDTAFDSNVFLYLWLDRGDAILAVARFRLKTLAERLVSV